MRKQVERNRKLYEYYLRESEKHGATYGDVGKVFDISASRAWRIVKTEQNKHRRHKPDKRVGLTEKDFLRRNSDVIKPN